MKTVVLLSTLGSGYIASILANADGAFTWDKIFTGQTGFVLGILFATAVFVIYILPRWDRHTAEVGRIADAVHILMVKDLERSGKSAVEIAEELDRLRGKK